MGAEDAVGDILAAGGGWDAETLAPLRGDAVALRLPVSVGVRGA